MKIIEYLKSNIDDIQTLVENLDPSQYTQKLEVLSGVSVGSHVRHILEFYLAIFKTSQLEICYDDRGRDIRIETDTVFAILIVRQIRGSLNNITSDMPMILKASFSIESDEPIEFGTSLFRELVYVLEHSIHHLAIIKIGMKYLGIKEELIRNFGLAPATIRRQVIDILNKLPKPVL